MRFKTAPATADIHTVLVLAAVGGVVVALYALAFEPYASPWVGDAPRYVEAARSLLRGEPLYNNIGLDGPRPMYLWPPGFSVLIAGVALFGARVLTSAYLLSCAGVALLLPAVYWAFYPSFGRHVALIAAALCFTGPGILADANLVGTEAIFLLFAVFAFGWIVRGGFFAAGFVVGLSLLIRNTGIALLPGLVLAAIVTGRSNRERASRITSGLVGLAIPYVGLAAWNLWANHTLTPYTMPPSTRGLLANLHDMGTAILFAAVPSDSISRLVPWQLPLLITAAISIAAASRALLAGTDAAVVRRGLAVAGCFVICGIALTIAGRTRYEWGADITARYASQYDWLLLPMAAVLALCLLPRRASPILLVAGSLAVVLVASRGWVVADRWAFQRESDKTVSEALASGAIPASEAGRHLEVRQFFKHYENMAGLATLSKQIDPRCTIVSNLYEVLMAQHDIAALSSAQQGLDGRDIVLIQALLPSTANDKAFADMARLIPVRIHGLPPSLRVFSSSPGRCLRGVDNSG